MAKTTIHIRKKLHMELKKRKLNSHDTYEGVIWDLLEANMHVKKATKKDIAAAVADYKAGRFYTLAEVKRKLRLK